jgi:LuxR family maltose regulon positive regulatory protein
MGIQLPNETIQQVASRTEGWLVGLQLLGLSLQEQTDPLKLLDGATGDQHYILDYLTEEVLHRQPQEVQTFLLCTSILDQLCASLCDAVLEQHSSHQMLKQLDQGNLFLVSLDSKRQWYRYHALFAQALHTQLEQTHGDLLPILHARASRWYAQHHQITPAILHAFKAREWHWAADLLEREHLPLISFVWGTGRHALIHLQQWLELLPIDILACRPRLCVTCAHMLWAIAPYSLLHMWLDRAEAAVRASLKTQTPMEISQTSLSPQTRQEEVDLLGEILTIRAHLYSYTQDGQVTLALCEQALAFLSTENAAFRAVACLTQLLTYYISSANDAVASIKSGYQAILFTQAARQPAVTVTMMALTTISLIGAGRLHEAARLTQRALLLKTPSGHSTIFETGFSIALRADIFREWNELETAHSLVTEAISLCERTISFPSSLLLYQAYIEQVRVCLSRGDLDGACTFFQQAEQIGQSMNQQTYQYLRSLFATIDQVRLWLACGDLDQATRWAWELDATGQPLTPFARERQEVAQVRILLARDQPTAALQRLEPVLQRATAGQRWGHVIEIRLLQALAYQRLDEEPQTLAALSEAVRLGEPEGYLRIFVEEGEAMAALLCKLQEEQRKVGPTAYLDRVLAAFPKQSQMSPSLSKRSAKQSQSQPLQEPLSERELQVLQLLAKGAANQEIAQKLVITVDTVKRHMSHVLAKLGVQNRVQAVKRAYELGLLDGVR